MAEQVVWASMRDVSEAADDDVKVADVTALFNTHVNDGRVILIVEGPDDREVYEKVTDSAATCIYADCSCEKHLSYLKWFSHWKHCGINFSDTILDLDIEMYFNACVANTNNDINVTWPDVDACKAAYKDVEKKELCNGHDILERIYVRAKAARVSNFAKKSFFRRLRGAYSKELFVNTLLYKDIKEFESASGCTVLAD